MTIKKGKNRQSEVNLITVEMISGIACVFCYRLAEFNKKLVIIAMLIATNYQLNNIICGLGQCLYISLGHSHILHRKLGLGHSPGIARNLNYGNN